MGVLLLGIVLFSLALTLRANQPGLLERDLAGCVWPAGAGVLYAVSAALMAGLTLRALLVLLLMAVAHTLYATLMGLAFAATGDLPPNQPWGPVLEGLTAYPPAVALQVAFVVPFAWVVLRRRVVAPGEMAVPGAELLQRAETPEALLHAILSVEGMQGPRADPALAAVARRARVLLSANAGRPAQPAKCLLPRDWEEEGTEAFVVDEHLQPPLFSGAAETPTPSGESPQDAGTAD